MTDQPPLLTRPAAGLAQITLRRAGTANRISRDDLSVLHAMLSECGGDDSLSVLILTGTGDYFSSGFDLDAMKERMEAGGDPSDPVEVRLFEDFTNAVKACPLITIAALNGPAIGGATDLALACDFRFGTETSSFMIPVARYGLPLYASAMARYVAAFGLDRAKHLILTGAVVKAPDLLSLGVLTQAVAKIGLLEYTLEEAQKLAASPRGPLLAMKAALNGIAAAPDTLPAIAQDLGRTFDASAILANIDAARARAKARK